MNVRAVFAVFGVVLMASAVFSAASPANAVATRTWTGGDVASNLWSDPDNWDSGVPVAGDLLVFPQAAQRKANVNDIAPATVFESITFTGSGYSISGNGLAVATELRNDPSSGTNTVVLAVGGTGGVVNAGGRLVLDGANTFSGLVSVLDGTLVASHDAALGAVAAGTDVSPGATLVLTNGTDTGAEPIEISGHGADSFGALQSPSGNTRAGDVTVVGPTTIGVASSTLVIGTLRGSGPLTLLGGGKLQVDSSFFTGNVTVEHGNLTWNASSQAFVTVEMEGWLRGIGTVASATVTGGLVWPGSGGAPGILNVFGQTTFLGGVFQVDLDGPVAGAGYGQLATGSLSLSPTSTLLDIDLTFAPSLGQVFRIIDVGGGAVSGTFLNLPEGAIFLAEGFAWRISYVGGDGNDVTITVLRHVTADLEIAAVASPSPAAAGSLLTYTITVSNEGPDASSSPTVTMGTPVGTTYESATGPANWKCSKPTTSASISCTGPTMPAGATAQFTFVFRVNNGFAGPVNGTVAVFSNTNDPFTTNNAATLLTPVGPGGGMQFRLVVPGVARDAPSGGSQG
jgi:uncharacterized repeat protein (TIGR01451 family)